MTTAGGPSHPDDVDPGTIELALRIFDYARGGETERLAAYVDQGVPVDLNDPDGNTLLMLAAYHDHVDTVAALVERGADVNRLNDRGQSPLAGAVFQASAGVVRVLVDAGADPEAGAPTAAATAEMFDRREMLE